MEWNKYPEVKPENRKEVLLLCKDGSKTYYALAEFIPAKTVLSEDYLNNDAQGTEWMEEYDEENDCYWCRENFFEFNYQSEMSWMVDKNDVIAWVELPKEK